MHLVGVVQALGDVLPVLAAIAGFQQCAVSAHGKAVLGIEESDIEQRGFTGKVFELLAPGRTAIVAGEDLRIVPDCPATLVVDEEHCGEQLPGRHPGLGPGLALVIGEQNVAAIAHYHQALASMSGIDQQALAGLCRFGGILLGSGGLRAARPHPQCQRQHCAGRQRPGTAPGLRHYPLPHDRPLFVVLGGSVPCRYCENLVVEACNSFGPS
ncbi:hypothetical protein D3C78_840250 [compost metagenome]